MLVVEAHLRVARFRGALLHPCTGRVSPVRWCDASYSRIVEKRGVARPGSVKFTKAETQGGDEKSPRALAAAICMSGARASI